MTHQLAQAMLTDGGTRQPDVRMTEETGCVLGLLPTALLRRVFTSVRNELSQRAAISSSLLAQCQVKERFNQE